MADSDVSTASETESLSLPTRLHWLRCLLTSPSFYLLCIVLIGGSFCGVWLITNFTPETVRLSLGPSAPVVTLVIHIVVALSPIPSDVISIANGAVYGFSLGAGLSWFGWWIAAILEFGLGYRVRKDFQFASECTLRFA